MAGQRRFRALSVKSLALLLVVLGLGVAVGLGVSRWRGGDCSRFISINPDLACAPPSRVNKAYPIELINDLLGYLDSARAAGKIDKAAVYFRDLRGGPTFGIDEDLVFTPASLLKLPVAIATLALAAERPGLLETRIVYEDDASLGSGIRQQNFVSASGLRVGATYSLRELLRSSISHSDNRAYFLVLRHVNSLPDIGEGYLRRAFQELGIVDPRDNEEEVVTVRGYASLFRLLYNVSYLDAANSELLLTWLRESSFDQGIVAGVPGDIAVAHKFGEREAIDSSRQLHDCGIVYLPSDTYSLCVMTKGRDWKTIAGVIGEVSRLVYDARARKQS